MISIIIQEHMEPVPFIKAMLGQASKLVERIEVIFATSMSENGFYDKHGPFRYNFPVRILGNLNSCGAARNAGGIVARGKELLFMDTHVCFKPQAVDRVLETLHQNPASVVAPALTPIEFPECDKPGGIAYGVVYMFGGDSFAWTWLPAERMDKEFPVPFVCGCMFAIKKVVFNKLQSYGGFLSAHTGLSWEEEATMRLWRLGHSTLTEPRATFGHYFKDYPGHSSKDVYKLEDWHKSFAVGTYINVFDPDVWEYINELSIKKWGGKWIDSMEFAKQKYSWLRAMLKPHAKNIDEKWFLRFKDEPWRG